VKAKDVLGVGEGKLQQIMAAETRGLLGEDLGH